MPSPVWRDSLPPPPLPTPPPQGPGQKRVKIMGRGRHGIKFVRSSHLKVRPWTQLAPAAVLPAACSTGRLSSCSWAVLRAGRHQRLGAAPPPQTPTTTANCCFRQVTLAEIDFASRVAEAPNKRQAAKWAARADAVAAARAEAEAEAKIEAEPATEKPTA